MSPSQVNRFHRAIRWLLAGALFALVPKCVMCLAAYVGVGALLGIKVGPEMCRSTSGPTDSSALWLAMMGTMIGLGLVHRWRRPLRPELK